MASFLSNFQRNIVWYYVLLACTHLDIQIFQPYHGLIWVQQPFHFEGLRAILYILLQQKYNSKMNWWYD